ncbi:MAG: hypothetical protein APR54_08980 [Candidatus Cloacimonas sp. SDB]|jgi:ArsR family transcriptional regulator, arsenate/arsenite/antimonite-responsive transcriptional repressor|nr:MAG: hypothetical protein APR54_08980 [Candidatus Cloacimonas sp. SDB]
MENIEKAAEFFKILSDPTRLGIVNLLLQHNYLCVNALTRRLNVTQSAVSQHLRILRQIGLVKTERKANFIHYSINPDILLEVKKSISSFLNTV